MVDDGELGPIDPNRRDAVKIRAAENLARIVGDIEGLRREDRFASERTDVGKGENRVAVRNAQAVVPHVVAGHSRRRRDAAGHEGRPGEPERDDEDDHQERDPRYEPERHTFQTPSRYVGSTDSRRVLPERRSH